jgi:hypothetical protein
MLYRLDSMLFVLPVVRKIDLSIHRSLLPLHALVVISLNHMLGGFML